MYIGDFAGAREYLEQGLSLYDPVQGPSYAELAPADTFVSMSAFLFLTLTWSGYLEQARRRHDAAFSEARRLAHTSRKATHFISPGKRAGLPALSPQICYNCQMRFSLSRTREVSHIGVL